ncbi:HrpWPma [Pseudomonas cannabina pv. alisalensis]|nr:pectate lyase [Pseudomonas cannabina]AFH66555.1 HrpWPma [Pseudomonas cannabina]KPW21051.1 HrpWPma [Pseudomonas cannabina pv. alisalensis]MBM0138978.1 pectate lyase [Pseudomonas cannabina pv. alisalensis]RMN80435.1 HrpWPma [Pseudomonas cannabina pv. alisalensis]
MSIGINSTSYQPASTQLDFSALSGKSPQTDTLAGQNNQAVDAEALLFGSDKQQDVRFGTPENTAPNLQNSSQTGDSQSNLVKLFSALIMSLIQMLANTMKNQDTAQDPNEWQDPFQNENGLGGDTSLADDGGGSTPDATGDGGGDTTSATGEGGGGDTTSATGDGSGGNTTSAAGGGGGGTRSATDSDSGGTPSVTDNGTTPTNKGSAPTGTGPVQVPKASGDTVVVNQTIKVGAGETFDGQGKTFTASNALGDGGQGESQKPLFELAEGATLKNVNLGQNEADGIHVKAATDAKVTIDNLHAENVGEDLITVKGEGGAKVTNLDIKNSSAQGADDKIIQLNADTHLNVDGFKATDFGTMVRTNGGKQFNDMSIELNGIDASHGKFALVKSDSEDLKLATGDIAMTDVKHAYDKTKLSTQHTEL